MLVERGFMARNELESILRSAIIDALLALTTPLAGRSSVSDIRFEAPGTHWAAAFVRLPLESVRSEVARRAEQMSRAGVADTVPVALADVDRGPAILTRDQWAIACRVNGSLTPRDLARQSGLPLYDTVTALGILLRRGLCTLAAPVPPPPRPSTPAAPDPPPSVTPPPRASTPLTPDPPLSVTPGPPPSAIAPAPRRAEAAAPAPAADAAAPAPRADSPAARPADADRTLDRPPRAGAPGPADPASQDEPVAGASGPRRTPSPAWMPSPDELLSQPGTGPQANLAAPRDVPLWDGAAPMRDPGFSRPARDGLAWGAHRGPADPPPPGPADPPEPPATRSGPASIPADAGIPPVRRQPSFTPIVTPAPLTTPELASPPPPVPSPVTEEPVPSAVLAAPLAVDSGAAARPPGPDEPASACRPLLPQRQPGAGVVQPPRNPAAPMPVPARDRHRPEPARAAEPDTFAATGPEAMAAPRPEAMPAPRPEAMPAPGPDAFGVTGSDLLRRVLDGLRRLT
jgi:hypothetical protein